MKGKGYLFEVAAIGYLRNDEGDIIDTDILYPITSILSKDYESAKFELIRKISDKDIEKYGSENIELIVRSFNNPVRINNTPSWIAHNSSGASITGYATTTGLCSGTSNVYIDNGNSTKITL